MTTILTPDTRPETAGTLTTLASEINKAHDAACQAAIETIQHVRRCGELLNEAKATIQHGEFLPWLAANCRVGERQARNYMRIAEHWGEITKSEPGADLTIKKALRLIRDLEPTFPLPPLSDDKRLLCLGADSLAIIEPLGGRYYYVGVVRGLDTNEPYVDETKRGIIDAHVVTVLRHLAFTAAAAWESEPFVMPSISKPGDELIWSIAARQYWRARVNNTEAA